MPCWTRPRPNLRTHTTQPKKGVTCRSPSFSFSTRNSNHGADRDTLDTSHCDTVGIILWTYHCLNVASIVWHQYGYPVQQGLIKGYLDVVRLLLNHGIDANAQDKRLRSQDWVAPGRSQGSSPANPRALTDGETPLPLSGLTRCCM
jgi:hypothetical protein